MCKVKVLVGGWRHRQRRRRRGNDYSSPDILVSARKKPYVSRLIFKYPLHMTVRLNILKVLSLLRKEITWSRPKESSKSRKKTRWHYMYVNEQQTFINVCDTDRRHWWALLFHADGAREKVACTCMCRHVYDWYIVTMTCQNSFPLIVEKKSFFLSILFISFRFLIFYFDSFLIILFSFFCVSFFIVTSLSVCFFVIFFSLFFLFCFISFTCVGLQVPLIKWDQALGSIFLLSVHFLCHTCRKPSFENFLIALSAVKNWEVLFIFSF